MTVEKVLQDFDGEEVVVQFDRPSRSWIVVALHSSLRGPCGGGTRMRGYAGLAEAIADAARLAVSMTYKFALAELPMGGGKAVLSVPEGLGDDERHDLLLRYGELVGRLGGLFFTGPDVGTSPEDMDLIAETGAPYVFGRTSQGGGCGGSSEPTALGVMAGIRATLQSLDGDDRLAGRRFALQGVGGVGRLLAEELLAEGAEVVVAEVDRRTLEELSDRLPVSVVDPEAIYDVECDVFSPCAVGGVLSAETIPRLRCRAVAGAANNQLATPEDGARLADRGILYAPDFAINAGGAIGVLGLESLGWSQEEARRRVLGISTTLSQIYARAAEVGTDTATAAKKLAERRLGYGSE